MADTVFLGSAYAEIDLRTGNFTKGMTQMQTSMSTLQGSSSSMAAKVTGHLDSLANRTIQFAAIAGLALGAAGLVFSKFALSTTGTYEMNRIAFETMLGSGELAGDLLKKLSDFAAKTPFELPQVVAGTKQLLAFGYTADEVIPMMRKMGDVAAALNIPIGDMAYLFGTLKTQGKAYTRDILQFTLRGIPMLDYLAKTLGVTKQAASEMVSAGKIGYAEVEKALDSMTEAGGKFGGLMDAQSKTLPGILSNIKDNITRVILAMMGMDLTGEIKPNSAYDQIKDAAMGLLQYLDTNREAIAKVLQGWVLAFINVAQWLAELVRKFMELPPAMKTFIADVAKVTLGLIALNVVLDKMGIYLLLTNIKSVGSFLGGLGGKLKNLRLEFLALIEILGSSGGAVALLGDFGIALAEIGSGGVLAGLGWIALAIGAVIATIVGMYFAWKDNLGGIRNLVNDAAQGIIDAWGGLVAVFNQAYKELDATFVSIGGISGALSVLGSLLKFVAEALGVGAWLMVVLTMKEVEWAIKLITVAVQVLIEVFKILFGPLADSMKRWGDLFKGYSDGMNGTSEKATKSFEDMAGKSVASTLKLSEGVQKTLYELQDNCKFITKDIADGMVAEIEKMKGNAIAVFQKNNDEAIAKLKYLRDVSKVITAEQYDSMAKKANDKLDEQKKKQDEVAKAIEDRITVLKDKGITVTQEMRTSIVKQINDMAVEVVRIQTDGNINQTLILEKLKASSGRITLEMASEAIKNSIVQRDSTIKAANEQYDTTIKNIIYSRDVSKTMTAEQAATAIANATKQRDDTIKAANEMSAGVVKEVQGMGDNVKADIDLKNGQILSGWQKFGRDAAEFWKLLGAIIQDVMNGDWAKLGKDIVALFNYGMASEKQNTINTATTCAIDAKGGLVSENVNAIIGGKELVTNFNSGMLPAKEVVKATTCSISDTALSGLKKNNPLAFGEGSWFSNQFGGGIGAGKGTVSANANAVGDSVSAANKHSGSAWTWGNNFDINFGAGLNAGLKYIDDPINQMCLILQRPHQSYNPLLPAMNWGKNLITNYAKGIKNAMPLLEREMSMMTGVLQAGGVSINPNSPNFDQSITNTNLSVNVGMYGGTEIEKRKMATEIFNAMDDVLIAKGKDPILGGV